MKPVDAKAISHDAEAVALRAEWARLRTEHQQLADETRRLRGSKDLAALRAHQDRLNQHAMDLHALTAAMELFHVTSGKVGGPEE